jgi:hypothetical protein
MSGMCKIKFVSEGLLGEALKRILSFMSSATYVRQLIDAEPGTSSG